MNVKQVNLGNKKEVEAFIHFPFELYRDHLLWVPPLLGGIRSALNPESHPSYQHTEAAFFTAQSGSEILARVGVAQNHRHNEYTKTRKAFFCFFEVTNDQQAANGVFERAVVWAKKRGLEMIIGPRGLIGSDGSGILVEGFEHPPALNVPYNYPYYDSLVTNFGFKKDTQHYSGFIDLTTYQFPERIFDMAEKIRTRGGFSIKSFHSTKELLAWAPRALEVHRTAFVNNHEYYPPTEGESQSIIDDLLSVADPRLIKLILHGEDVVGFILAYPNINEGIRKAKGGLWPFGWYHLLQAKKKSKWVDVNGLGILPEFRGMGSNALLYLELVKTIKELGYEHLEAVMVDENNFRSKSDNLTMGVTFYKTHRCYEMLI